MNGHYTHSDGTPLAPNERVDNEGNIYTVTERNAPAYAYRIAGDVLRDLEPDGPGTSVSTLGALAEAARRGYELGNWAAQSL